MKFNYKSKHQGVVGFEYVIILIIMSVALFGTFSVLSTTLKNKGIDIAEFINGNGQNPLGSKKKKDDSESDDPNDENSPAYWIQDVVKGWRGSSEMTALKSPYYFQKKYKDKLPEYLYAWDEDNSGLYQERFTKDDHLMGIEGKDGKYYYLVDPGSDTDPTKFKSAKKYKYSDIMGDY